jgi:hypothetical protein
MAMEDESIIEALTPIRGVGRWTVQMLLMFRLHRYIGLMFYLLMTWVFVQGFAEFIV